MEEYEISKKLFKYFEAKAEKMNDLAFTETPQEYVVIELVHPESFYSAMSMSFPVDSDEDATRIERGGFSDCIYFRCI